MTRTAVLIEDDEIAVLARLTMALGHTCQETIDRNIAHAYENSQWDEMHKWQRVRLRIERLRRKG